MSLPCFDLHNHTRHFSPDGKQSLSELIAHGQKIGLKGLMLTEHYDKDVVDGYAQLALAPYGKPAPQEWVFDIQQAYQKLQKEKKLLPSNDSNFKLLYGIEVGWIPEQKAEIWPYLKNFSSLFDGIIASVHCVDLADIYYERQLYQQGRDYAYGHYLDAAIALLEADLDFDILGHYDYVVRYAPWPQPALDYEEQAQRLDHLFQLLIKQEKALEINTRTRYRYWDATGEDIGFPDKKIIQRYLELGGRHIVLSSDSHEAGNGGRLFSETLAFLRSCGVTELCHFEQRQCYWDKI